ncbi:MAG TPA: hypothetical protein VEI45_19080 [Mycobacterium sp.]|uniref:hypothetical protein n=1 Tax=Mycobacterium sp. TaxID=1785 RepID=UPI002D63F893|nr:hypothetical protein [Mycobacterium sp.]HXY66399.1 hypothetical protein [Mycobacterium sp.]
MTSDSDGPDDNKNLKWAMGAVGAVAVLATIVAVVLLFGGGGSGAPKGAQQDNGSAQDGVASAKDTGPVTVITDDPSCAAWTSINNELANSGAGLWNDRDRSVPASAWTPKLRAQFIAAAQSMRGAAAQAVGLVKLTPHRVMRELYQQFIAYARAYAERVPKYTPADNNLAGAANSASSALGAICAAVIDGPAAARGPLVPPSAPPSDIAPVGNPVNPQPFLTTTNQVCDDWKLALDRFGKQTNAWQKLDPNIPAIYWNREQRAVNYAVAPVMNTYASKLEQLGRQSDNAIWQDFANLAAQYRRAFVVSLPTYTPTDNHLANAANYASTTILGACAAVGM